jgi:hypothetical protein
MTVDNRHKPDIHSVPKEALQQQPLSNRSRARFDALVNPDLNNAVANPNSITPYLVNPIIAQT